jgi:hypothetical protein
MSERRLPIRAVETDGELRSETNKNRKSESDIKPVVRMPIRAKPYKHQIAAFNFAMKIFGETAKGGDANDIQQGT